MNRFYSWLIYKWKYDYDKSLLESYYITFSTEHGQRVLHHLLDSVYCTIYEGLDPIMMATLNGRRSLVHEILENIDQVERPNKHTITMEG